MRILTVAAAAVAALCAFGTAGPASAQQLCNSPLGDVACTAGIGAGIGTAIGGRSGALWGLGIGAGASILNQAAQPPAYAAPPRPPQYPPQQAYAPSYADYSYQTVWQIQSGLQYLGYNPGPVDGQYGGRTKNAIWHYQEVNGLAVDGVPSQYVLNHIRQFL